MLVKPLRTLAVRHDGSTTSASSLELRHHRRCHHPGGDRRFPPRRTNTSPSRCCSPGAPRTANTAYILAWLGGLNLVPFFRADRVGGPVADVAEETVNARQRHFPAQCSTPLATSIIIEFLMYGRLRSWRSADQDARSGPPSLRPRSRRSSLRQVGAVVTENRCRPWRLTNVMGLHPGETSW